MSPHLMDSTLQTTELESPRWTLAEHLEELRRRLGICLVAVLLGAGVGFASVERAIEWLKRPAGDLLPRLAFLSPTEALVAYVNVALTIGVVMALPMILYQLWAFVKPGLRWRERYYGLAFVWWGSVLFVLGAGLAYRVVLPMGLRFLLGIGGPTLEPVISVSRYLGFVTGVMLACGAVFEVPLAVAFLTHLGLVTPTTLRARRGWALVVMLVVLAILTPTTDALTLILMTVPLAALYEGSILIARWSSRPSRKAFAPTAGGIASQRP